MATATTDAGLMTAGDLLRLSSKKVKGELVRGVFRKIEPAGAMAGEAATAVGAEVSQYVRPRRLGRVSSGGVHLERRPDTVRKPGVAYISAAKLPLDVKVWGYYEVIPDLIAEIAPTAKAHPWQVADRVAMWHSYGVPLVWAVYPALRTVAAHSLNGTTVSYTEDDVLDGGAVIPGFQCLVRDILDP